MYTYQLELSGGVKLPLKYTRYVSVVRVVSGYQGRPYPILEGLCRCECWRRGGLDLQLLARARVASRASLSGAPLERPEALQADLLSLCSHRETAAIDAGLQSSAAFPT